MKHFEISDTYSLPLAIVTERVAWLGQSGSGKTYAAMKLAELMLKVGAQVVVLDPIGHWWGLRASADGKKPGFPINLFGGERADVPITPEGGALVAETVVEKGISAIIDVSDFTLGERARFAISFAERFWQAKKKAPSPVHLFMEEAHNFLPQNIPAADAKGDPRKSPAVMLNRMELLARQGRGKGIGMSMITQMPQSVNKHALNQCGTVFAMRTMGTHERKAISGWVSDKATDEAQLDLADRLPTLKTGEAWVASPHFLKVFKAIRVAERETFDSSKTPEFGVTLAEPKVLAPVDVAALRTAMAAVVEQAEKDDPAKLRRRIVELEKALKTGKPADADHLQRFAEQNVALRAEKALLERDIAGAKKALSRIATSLDEAVHIAHEAVAAYPKTGGAHARAEFKDPARLPKKLPIIERPVVVGTRGAVETSITEFKLSQKQKEILALLAGQEGGTAPRERLALWVGMAASGGGFSNYLGALRSSGLVEYTGEGVTITETGRAHAGEETVPADTEQLLEMWRLKFSTKQVLMLDRLADGPCTKAELAKHVEMDPDGGGFSNYLGQLRTAGLVNRRGEPIELLLG